MARQRHNIMAIQHLRHDIEHMHNLLFIFGTIKFFQEFGHGLCLNQIPGSTDFAINVLSAQKYTALSRHLMLIMKDNILKIQNRDMIWQNT